MFDDIIGEHTDKLNDTVDESIFCPDDCTFCRFKKYCQLLDDKIGGDINV